MKKWKQILAGGLILSSCWGVLSGCTAKEPEKEQTVLTIKVPPLTVANANTDLTDMYDVLIQAGKEFAAQYKGADVTVNVVKFDYVDEDKYITDCFDTENAADILFEGYFNMAGYIHTGRVVPLDDLITDDMKSDIDRASWEMSQINGKTTCCLLQPAKHHVL